MIEVFFFAGIRELTGTKQVKIPPCANVRELLELLETRFGSSFRNKVLTDDGNIAQGIIIMVNGRHVQHSGGTDTPLQAGDQVSIFPMVAGG